MLRQQVEGTVMWCESSPSLFVVLCVYFNVVVVLESNLANLTHEIDLCCQQLKLPWKIVNIFSL